MHRFVKNKALDTSTFQDINRFAHKRLHRDAFIPERLANQIAIEDGSQILESARRCAKIGQKCSMVKHQALEAFRVKQLRMPGRRVPNPARTQQQLTSPCC